MSNRQKIEGFCRNNNIEIISIEYRKQSKTAIFESNLSGIWYIECKFPDGDICQYDSIYPKNNLSECVELMIKEIKNDIIVS